MRGPSKSTIIIISIVTMINLMILFTPGCSVITGENCMSYSESKVQCIQGVIMDSGITYADAQQVGQTMVIIILGLICVPIAYCFYKFVTTA